MGDALKWSEELNEKTQSHVSDSDVGFKESKVTE